MLRQAGPIFTLLVALMLHAPPGLLPHFLEPTTRNALEKFSGAWD